MSTIAANTSGTSRRKVAKRPASLASRLAVALEADIVSGKLRPGTRLDEQALARRFKASRTPVREALRQLESRGMVENRPRQGAQVMQLSLASLIEMFEAMAWLEAACASLAARRHTQADRDAIQAAHEACVAAQQALEYLADALSHPAPAATASVI